MIKFTVKTEDLKKALSIAVLATGKTSSNILSHSLFSIENDSVTLYSTDQDKIAKSYLPVTDLKNSNSENILFTAEPKRIEKLINSSENTEFDFSYDPKTKTLKIYTSENSKSYISFPSFNTEDFLNFKDDLENINVENISSNILLAGIRFTSGFISKNEKDKKFSNIFIHEGTIYGTNGSIKIGAFQNMDLEKVPSITIRKQMISPLLSMLEKISPSEILIGASEKYIVFFSSDYSFCFGFRNSTITIPRMPISLEIPEVDGFNVNRLDFQRKLDRLSLSSWEDVGVKMTIKEDIISMETLLERKSQENIKCERLQGDKNPSFIIECEVLKKILAQFSASNIDFYIDKKKCTIYSSADLEYKNESDELVSIPFIATGSLTFARIA